MLAYLTAQVCFSWRLRTTEPCSLYPTMADGSSTESDNKVTDFCRLCYFHKWPEKPAPFDSIENLSRRINSFHDLQVSAQNGCPGCQILHHVWDHVGNQHVESEIDTLSFLVGYRSILIEMYDNSTQMVDVFTSPGK